MNLKNYKNNLLFVNLLFKTVENYKKFIIKTVILNQLLKSLKTKKGDQWARTKIEKVKIKRAENDLKNKW